MRTAGSLKLDQGCRVWLLGFGFRVYGIGLWVQGFGLVCFGFRISLTCDLDIEVTAGAYIIATRKQQMENTDNGMKAGSEHGGGYRNSHQRCGPRSLEYLE